MRMEVFVQRLEYNVMMIKAHYERYQKYIEITFQGKLPLPIAHREEAIQLLFENLALLVQHRQKLYFDMAEEDTLQEMGKYIYDQLQNQIQQLDCLCNLWAYEVQKVLTDIRVCFYYLLQEIDEMDVQKNVDIPIGKC